MGSSVVLRRLGSITIVSDVGVAKNALGRRKNLCDDIDVCGGCSAGGNSRVSGRGCVTADIVKAVLRSATCSDSSIRFVGDSLGIVERTCVYRRYVKRECANDLRRRLWQDPVSTIERSLENCIAGLMEGLPDCVGGAIRLAYPSIYTSLSRVALSPASSCDDDIAEGDVL